jgi:hypothetical protein
MAVGNGARIYLVAALLVTLGACGSSDGDGRSAGTAGYGEVPSGPFLDGDCDPLVPDVCALPFPSDAFTVPDESSVTGKRVKFAATTLPGPTDPSVFELSDGFSPGAGITTFLPGATTDNLPDPLNIERSLEPGSPTVLIEAETLERVPHFSELDMSHDNDARRAFIVRPVVRLKPGMRYIVAIRNVVDAAGAALEPSPAFRALRDDEPSDEGSVDLRRALYDDIFGRLEDADVPRGELQLAWDFTVASDENITRWMLHMRDEALAELGDSGPPYRIDDVQVAPNADVALRIEGHITVPLYLDDPGPGGRLVLGSDGLPVKQGTAEYPFLVIIPESARTTAAAPLQIGHGLFGQRTQAEGFSTFANQLGYALIAMDLAGMSTEDVLFVRGVIIGKDISEFAGVTDRLQQGLLNWLLSMRMMMKNFADDPQLLIRSGETAIDKTQQYYLGGSQGGIFGASYMALSTDVERGILGVPGQPYNLLLNRSVDFDAYLAVLRGAFSDPIEIQIVLGLTQMLWDRAEPTGYSHRIERPFAGTPPHRVLMQVAIGDHQVTTLGAHVMARAIGAKNMLPNPRSIFGVEETNAPYEGSAMVEYDFGLPPEPITNVPMREGSDPHGQVKNVPASGQQVDTFLRTGVVQWFCDGPCDPN